MITESILSIFFLIAKSILSLFVSIFPAIDVTQAVSAIQLLVGSALFFNGVLPMTTIFTVIFLGMSVEISYFFWNVLHWILRKIPTIQ